VSGRGWRFTVGARPTATRHATPSATAAASPASGIDHETLGASPASMVAAATPCPPARAVTARRTCTSGGASSVNVATAMMEQAIAATIGRVRGDRIGRGCNQDEQMPGECGPQRNGDRWGHRLGARRQLRFAGETSHPVGSVMEMKLSDRGSGDAKDPSHRSIDRAHAAPRSASRARRARARRGPYGVDSAYGFSAREK
jgi:hypothetical protein